MRQLRARFRFWGADRGFFFQPPWPGFGKAQARRAAIAPNRQRSTPVNNAIKVNPVSVNVYSVYTPSDDFADVVEQLRRNLARFPYFARQALVFDLYGLGAVDEDKARALVDGAKALGFHVLGLRHCDVGCAALCERLGVNFYQISRSEAEKTARPGRLGAPGIDNKLDALPRETPNEGGSGDEGEGERDGKSPDAEGKGDHRAEPGDRGEDPQCADDDGTETETKTRAASAGRRSRALRGGAERRTRSKAKTERDRDAKTRDAAREAPQVGRGSSSSGAEGDPERPEGLNAAPLGSLGASDPMDEATARAQAQAAVLAAVEAATAAAAVDPTLTRRPTMVIDKPVRSGQQYYAEKGDLICHAIVNEGGELLADGNIHVYAPMRGRALAGVSGDKSAEIFILDMQAQLVSVAGVYRTFESKLPAGLNKKPVRISLNDDLRLSIQSLEERKR